MRAVKPLDEEPYHKVTLQQISQGLAQVPGMQIAPRSTTWMMPLQTQAMDPTKVRKSFEFKGREAS